MRGDVTEVLVGLRGFQVRDVSEVEGEVHIDVELVRSEAPCPGCGTFSGSVKQRPSPVRIKDAPSFGRRVVVWWWKRRFRCREPWCPRRSFTETSEEILPRARTSERLRDLAWKWVKTRPALEVASELGVSWRTVWRHSRQRIEDRLAACHDGSDESGDTFTYTAVAPNGASATGAVSVVVVADAHELIDPDDAARASFAPLPILGAVDVGSFNPDIAASTPAPDAMPFAIDVEAASLVLVATPIDVWRLSPWWDLTLQVDDVRGGVVEAPVTIDVLYRAQEGGTAELVALAGEALAKAEAFDADGCGLDAEGYAAAVAEHNGLAEPADLEPGQPLSFPWCWVPDEG